MGINVYFGSKDQDKWVIEDIFKFKTNGYFVDLAATNGLFENNTYVLEKKYNWTGIAIEPNEKFYKKLIKIRNCKTFNVVILSNESEVNFLEDGPTGGVIGEEFDNNYLKRSSIIKEKSNKILKKKSRSLKSILKEANAPKEIDYLSLDVEGAETSVLKNFPFHDFIFLCMSIERPSSELNKILFKNDYIFVKNFKADTFYVHKRLLNKFHQKINLEKFEQIPQKSW